MVGLAISSRTVTTETQARIANSDVHIVKGSIKGSVIDERTVDLWGDFCYSRYLQSGGTEKWAIYPANETGGQQSPRNGSDHIDTGSIDISAGGGFPAHCKRVDDETGEAEWQVKNVNTMQPHNFLVRLHFPQKLDEKYCPSIHLNYKGTWMSGMPFAKVDLKKIAGICKPSTTPSPVTSPSVSPSVSPPQAPVSPAQQPLPSVKAQGYITVYGCKKPDFVSLDYCKNDTCSEKGSLSYNQNNEKAPVAQGVWLEDTNVDNTWVYRYSLTTLGSGPIDPTKPYKLLGASATFNNGTVNVGNKAEDPKSLEIKLGTQRDFQIYAEQTCSCPIKAVASIKDKNGNLITELDNQVNLYGTANNNQFFQNSTRPNTPFRNGQIIVGPGNYPDLYVPSKYGYDTFANVKLFAPGWKVLRQDCISKGTKPACPIMASESSVTSDKLPRPELFERLRVTCGVELEYGWILEKLPVSPAPAVQISPVAVSPQPKPPVVQGDIITGLTCALRDDSQPEAEINTLCKLRNLERRHTWQSTIEVDWDRPNKECRGYKPESDQAYMAIVRRSTDGAVVAVKKNITDQTPDLGVKDREWDGIPGTKVALDTWGVDVPYNLYVYAQKLSNPSCVSQPITFGFKGPEKDD